MAYWSNISLKSYKCNVFYSHNVTLIHNQTIANIFPTKYFEIEFDIDIHSLCNNPVGGFSYDISCGVLHIGQDKDTDVERYPALLIGNEEKGNNKNYWYSRLTTGIDGESMYGEELVLSHKELTSIGIHHIHIIMTPKQYTITIDNISENISFDSNRVIPSNPNGFPLYLSPPWAMQPENATLYNVCIRSLYPNGIEDADIDYSSMRFGFKTSTSFKSESKSNITITLFLNIFEYQCQVDPINNDTYYLCDISTLNQCQLSSKTENGIQIDNNNGDNQIEIDQIVFMDKYNNINSFYIEIFCFDEPYKINNNCVDILPLSNDDEYSFIFISLNTSIISYVYPMNEPLAIQTDICKYIFVNNHTTWEYANKYCLSHYGSYLATVIKGNDINITQNIQIQYNNSTVWIGLTDKFTEEDWIWIDNTSCDYVYSGLCKDDYHWDTGEPDNYDLNQDYGELYASGLFNDVDNSNSGKGNPFLCNNPDYIETLKCYESSNKFVDTADITDCGDKDACFFRVKLLGNYWRRYCTYWSSCGFQSNEESECMSSIDDDGYNVTSCCCSTNNCNLYDHLYDTKNPSPSPTDYIVVKTDKNQNIWLSITIGSALSFIIILIIFGIWCHQKRIRLKTAAQTLWIKKPMIIAVCIGDYDDINSVETKIVGTFKDLYGIEQDIKNLFKLFVDTLNYQIFPYYNIDGDIKKQIVKTRMHAFLE